MTALDAFDRAVCDDAQLAEGLDRPHPGCSQMQVFPLIPTSPERLSARASSPSGGWSMSDATEGATA